MHVYLELCWLQQQRVIGVSNKYRYVRILRAVLATAAACYWCEQKSLVSVLLCMETSAHAQSRLIMFFSVVGEVDMLVGAKEEG